MNFAIMEPGLTSLAGHHFDHAFRLARSLQQSGYGVQVHCHVSCSPKVEAAFAQIGIQVGRTFRVQSYVAPAGEDNPGFWLALVRTTEQDLQHLPPADLAFWPSLGPVQLLAMAGQPYGQRICGGLDGNIDGVHAGRSPWGVELIARGARLLRRLQGRIILGAYDRRMADIYSRLLPDVKIVRFPVPYDRILPVAQPAQTLSRIGFFGAQRPERGSAMLPALVRELIDRGKTVILHDSSGRIGLKGSHPNLKILGFVQDFASQVAACDLIVWPSDPSAYGAKTSGIIWNAIACGIPVVLPSDCLPAQIAAEAGAAVPYQQRTAAAILEAIDHAEANFPQLTARASRKANDWSVTEGVDRLAAAMTGNGFRPWVGPAVSPRLIDQLPDAGPLPAWRRQG